MLDAKIVELMQCEWCPDAAIYRVTARVMGETYRRFACRAHVEKVDRLVQIDLGDRVRESVVNPTCFALATGRMLGPER
jgi:hypothetical protein